MKVEIPCYTYSRMAEVPKTLDAADERQYLRSLLIERKANHLYVVGTNARCMAIEHLGVNEGPDEFCAIVIDADLIKACEAEAPHNGTITINGDHTLRYGWINTTFGFVLSGNGYVHLPDGNWLQRWRELIPNEPPTQSHGTMFWGCASVAALSFACISGGIKFPEYIDTRQAVLINDADNPDWIGLFMPTQKNVNEKITPVIIPDWVF